MNRMIRGVAGLLVALGASACSSDYGLDFETEPTQIQASPEVMFITSGAAAKELLLRLTNDINQSVPTTFTVSNVPAGLTVTHDDNYRPDYVNPDGTLQQPDELGQQRYYVSADMPTGGQVSFTVSSGGFSKDITVRVLPTNLGSALSSTAPAVGEEVTITAPANLSFTSASTVNIPGGGNAVITAQDAKSITFIPIPGSDGVATVSNVTLDYAPTLDPRSLATVSTITVPAVASVPLQFSSSTPLTPVTVTATGFRFESGFTLTVGGKSATTVSVAGDGTSATVVLPPSTTGNPTASGIHLSFLPSVSLSDIPAPTTLTLGAPAWNGALQDGTAAVLNAAAAGTEVVVWDSWLQDNAGDAGFWGGNGRYVKLVLTSGGTRQVCVGWNNDADVDMVVTAGSLGAYFAVSAGSANPECANITAGAGTYWIAMGLYDGAKPDVVRISVK